MAISDAILTRLLSLHPKIIDLTLDRMWRILDRLGNPQDRLPPVVHVAGTNGKGSTIAFMRAMIEASGMTAHCYTSPHLVRFHERIRVGRKGGGILIPEPELSALLEECEVANGGEPITFFEITTAAAFLAFSRMPADYLLLEVGLGGRLDATNVVARPALCIITTIDFDHQQFLGDTLPLIAAEKAGILKPGVTGIIGVQPFAARETIEASAARVGAPLLIANQDWQSYEQHGRLIFQDDSGLLDLPMPQLLGRHQIDNAGNAIAAVRATGDGRFREQGIAEGLRSVAWPARMQRLGPGALHALVPGDCEIWLDGGHNPAGGRALAQSMSELNERYSRPLVLIWGMLNTKEPDGYIAPFTGIVHRVVTMTIPGEENAVAAEELARIATYHRIPATAAASLEEALRIAGDTDPPPRILICGSLYLAGRVLAAHLGEAMSEVTGTARR
jgi:dihydrofolate synthase/folylpolyglutamate synthase